MAEAFRGLGEGNQPLSSVPQGAQQIVMAVVGEGTPGALTIEPEVP